MKTNDKQIIKNQINPVLKRLDAPVEVLIIDPITLPIAQALADIKIHPLVVTFFAFVFRLIAAYFFVFSFNYLGSLFAFLGFVLDGIDGKIARIRHIDEELHGTIDFLLDQVAFAILGIAILIQGILNKQNEIILIMGSWLALYMIMMAFTSTWHRLISQGHLAYKQGVGEDIFKKGLQSKSNNVIKAVLGFSYNTFILMRTKLARFRMQPYLGAIESEVVIFMIAPIFNFAPIISGLGLLLLIPDIFMVLTLNLMRVTQKKLIQ